MKKLIFLLFPLSAFAQSDTLSLKKQKVINDSLFRMATAAMARANIVDFRRRTDSANDASNFRTRPIKIYYDSVFNARSVYNEATYVKKTDFNSVKNSVQAMSSWSAQAQSEMDATQAKANAGVDTATFKADQYRQDTIAQALAGKVNMNSAAITGLQGSFATINNSLANYRTLQQNNGLYYPLTGNPSNFLNSEVDGSITNELQGLAISGNTITLSSGGGSVTVPYPTINQVPALPDSLLAAYNRYQSNVSSINSASSGQAALLARFTNDSTAKKIRIDSVSAATVNNATAINTASAGQTSLTNRFTSDSSAQWLQINNKVPQTRTLTINGIAFDLSANRSWQVGDVTTANLNAGLATKEPTVTASTTSTYYRGDKTFQPLTTDVVTEGANLFFTNARSRSAIALTTTGTGAATYNQTTGALNIPPLAFDTANKWQWLPTFNNAPARTIVTTAGAAGYQISVTRPTRVSYTVSCAALVTVGQAIANLEISSNNSTWLTITQAGQTSIALLNTLYYNLQCDVPPGWYVRIRSTVTGGGVVAFVAGQEVIN